MKIALLLMAFVLAHDASLAQSLVYRVKVESVINPSSAEYVEKAIESAVDERAACLVVEMDTPGGLMKSMNAIVKNILSSEIPVVVYVSPSGSHCASAGVFIMMAAHVAAMAPGTNIGAAHPVTIGQGGSDSTSQVMMEKVTNDAVSYIRSLAEKNGRNADWVEDAVRKSVSITETEALQKHVIDVVAPSLDSLLVRIDGRKVETIVGRRTLQTAGAVVKDIERSWRYELLDILTDPNVAYILMMLGIYGLFFELYNPGSVLPGVIGGICLILAFYSFHTLPINYAGLALIIFGVILLLLEIKVTSYGVLSIGGILSLLLGSVMLIDSPDQLVSLSWGVIVPMVLFTAAFFLFIVGMGLRAQSQRVYTGKEGMVGETGTVLESFGDGRIVRVTVHGEIWKAVSDSPLTVSDQVRIVRVDNLSLKVERV
jgi:membrane-bound serine protease (ClpP class)